MNEGLPISREFLSTPPIASTALIAGAVGSFANLALRRTPATA